MGRTDERRANRRYEVDLVIRYRITDDRTTSNWRVGTTCDLGSSGIGFRCRGPLPIGARIEMMIHWPAKQDDLYPIYLHAIGFVVRSRGRLVGARITFRRMQVEKGTTGITTAGATMSGTVM